MHFFAVNGDARVLFALSYKKIVKDSYIVFHMKLSEVNLNCKMGNFSKYSYIED